MSSKPLTDIWDLVTALREVSGVLTRYDGAHGRKWETQSVAVHIKHAVEHMELALNMPDSQRARTELAHAATRALMALTLA